jgi:L-ascorbate metabolism protein UlaG (beta-lactamase superfamily)
MLVEIGEARILIDPGPFSEGYEDLDQVDAILITHKDYDHFGPDAVSALMTSNPQAALIVEPASRELVPDTIAEDRIRTVQTGDHIQIRGVAVDVVGGRHAAIHPEIDRIPNVGFFFSDVGLLNPGDEWVQPEEPVRVLALPVSGPWLSLEDTVEYLRALRPTVAFPIHEVLHSRPEIYYKYIAALKPEETSFQVLEPGVPTELG